MALPLTAVPQPAAGGRFRRQLDRLGRHYRRLWLDSSDDPPRLGPRQGRRRQWSNRRAARRLIERLADEIRRYPEEPAARAAWRERLRESVTRFGEERLGWPAGYRELLFADAFYDSTVRFTRAARAFDPELQAEELGQALRNVWIMNSLQMLLDLEVRFTPAIFAYSMLYPVTDNRLDDPGMPLAAKRQLNRWMTARLAGGQPPARDAAEERIGELLDRIEDQYPRTRFPEVWRSLEAIHRGQVASLRQQGGGLAARELLAISVAKGGASVLADGWLAAGELEPAAAEFCFGYGVFLQLLDDLQDAAADREAGHATLFSTARPPLDRLAGRLDRFMRRVVGGADRFRGERYAQRRDLILRNCRALLVGAVAEQPELFSRGFRHHLEHRWPLRFRALRRLRQLAERRLRAAGEELRAERGVGSLLDVLD